VDRVGGYGSLLFGIGSWFGFWGSQMVILQWLLVEGLAASPGEVGAAQAALTLPSLLFLLVGGAVADRLDPVRLMAFVHLATAAAVVALGLCIAAGELGYALLVVYAALVGTLQAFGFPARDTLLSEVVRGPLSRAVAGTTLTQHASQVVGSFVAGTASAFGALPVLGAQALVLGLGALRVVRLPRPSRARRADPLSLSELRAGIVEVARSPVLRPVLILAVATGVLFVGPYIVILPLLVRDVYGGGAAEMAVLNAMFPLGSVIGGGIIFWRGGLERSGRALCLGQVTASFFIASLALELPFAGSVLAVLGWGLAGALFINSGRTLFQSRATESNRARVLSVYSLGVMGGAPLGSIASGLLASSLGIHGTLALDGAIALAVALGVVASTSLWRET
jgi:MFS family permease